MKEIKTYPLKEKYLDLKGLYWVGDPCYIIRDKEWQKLCDLMYPTHNTPLFDDTNTVRVVEVDGVKCYTFGTAHGDGCYDLQIAGESVADLGVDAGMLSLIPVDLTRLGKGWGKSEPHGHLVSFEGHKVRIKVKGGNFQYGELTINTDYEDDDDSI